MFSSEDWQKIAQTEPLNRTQKDRMASMTMLYGVINQFYGTYFPNLRWHLGHDALIAAAWSGNTMPWATDGHVAIESGRFYTNETWNKLKAFEQVSYLNSPECQNTTFGRCLGVMLPKDVAGQEKIMLALRPFEDGLSDRFAYSRFVDLNTGFFVGVIGFDPATPPQLKKCRLGGLDLPVPEDVSKYLSLYADGYPYGKEVDSDVGREAIIFPEAHMECTAQRCDELHVDQVSAAASNDPFKLNFWRFYEFGAGKGRWTPVSEFHGNNCVSIISTKSKRYPVKVKPLCA